jgi:MoxR-like ATPase
MVRIEHLTTDGLLDPSLFVARGDELERILIVIQNRQFPVLVEEVAGSGKTSLLTVVKRRLEGRVAELNTLYIDPEVFVERVAKQWGVKAKGKTAEERLEDMISRLDTDKSYVLIVETRPRT